LGRLKILVLEVKFPDIFNKIIEDKDLIKKLLKYFARIRALYMLGIKFSSMAFIQYNSATDSVSTNVRLRYNPREGIDLYVVYNESFNTNRYREEPVLPFASNRTVMLKYTYTFNL
jgi:Holliday junction resolvase